MDEWITAEYQRQREVKLDELDEMLVAIQSESNLLNLLLSIRGVVDQWRRLSLPNTKSFIRFIAIDSDADGYPLGDVRNHWNKDKLKVKDEELVSVFAGLESEAVGHAVCLRKDLSEIRKLSGKPS